MADDNAISDGLKSFEDKHKILIYVGLGIVALVIVIVALKSGSSSGSANTGTTSTDTSGGGTTTSSDGSGSGNISTPAGTSIEDELSAYGQYAALEADLQQKQTLAAAQAQILVNDDNATNALNAATNAKNIYIDETNASTNAQSILEGNENQYAIALANANALNTINIGHNAAADTVTIGNGQTLNTIAINNGITNNETDIIKANADAANSVNTDETNNAIALLYAQNPSLNPANKQPVTIYQGNALKIGHNLLGDT